MNHPSFYQRIDRFSLRFAHYAFLDTDAYLADHLFIKHQVWVCFREELPNKMMLLGYTDYLDACRTLWSNEHCDELEEVDGHDTIDSIGQAQ